MLIPIVAGGIVLAALLLAVLRWRRPVASPAAPWQEPPPAPAQRVGSGRPIAEAVAQALAVREARNGGPPTGRGDARDRLLAVLLHDPAQAVDAAVELEACLHERSTIGAVLGRLAASGLEPDQLVRLSGLTADEVGVLLAPVSPRSG